MSARVRGLFSLVRTVLMIPEVGLCRVTAVGLCRLLGLRSLGRMHLGGYPLFVAIMRARVFG